ncbi:uncharacterized protein LOC117221349 [Megalopta genalis]|uniref:uncharacterized protein LOC117221349 n=1 Tax=Megalopta genalis TaxID=115081 RepID=UPI003FCFD44D
MSQESQEMKKAILKTRSVTNEQSKAENSPRLRTRRLITESKSPAAKKQSDLEKEPDSNDRKEIRTVTRSKKLKRNNEEQIPKLVKNSKVRRNKQLNNTKQNKRIKKNNLGSRQTSLRESFLNQSMKLSHVCQKFTTPQEDVMLVAEHLSPRSRKSLVLVKKLCAKKRKVPIYKCLSPERSVHNASEIYEFKFDINDSKEQLPKKKRKKIAVKKTLITKKKKKEVRSKKQDEQKVVNKTATPNNVPLEEGDIKFSNTATKESDARARVRLTDVALKGNNIESINVASQSSNVKPTVIAIEENNDRFADILPKGSGKIRESIDEVLHTGNSVKSTNENALPEIAEKSSLMNLGLNKESLVQSENASKELFAESTIKKPKISIPSTQDTNNEKIAIVDNMQISKSDNFKPFRPTNVFNNKILIQQRTILNNSLFEKSLSPITKLSEHIEFSSPWKAPAANTFSQVRNVFQSTPQNKKYEVSSKKFLRTITNETKSYENTTKRKGSLLKNDENVSPGYINTNSKKRNSAMSRKFGTEITNIDHCVQSNIEEDISGRASVEVESTQPSVELSSRINSSVNNLSLLNSIESNVNEVSNRHVSKKNVIETNQICSPPKMIENMQVCDQKENLDPQPGPSGLQKIRILNEQKSLLRQSNLNNFFNIMDMPQSTSVRTPHGIFDDISSTPINSKSMRKPKIFSSDLKNAFGFYDDDSSKDVSLVKQSSISDENKKEIPVAMCSEKSNEKPFARISIGEIKNTLFTKKLKKNIQTLKDPKNEGTAKGKVPTVPKQHVLFDIANFSDTFDICSENSKTPAMDTSEPPLFVDLEPSHFIQPARYSYKRKRNVKSSFSDEETETEGGKDVVKSKTKRKKTDKVKTEEKHKMRKWIEDINKTFDEIDHFELVVE